MFTVLGAVGLLFVGFLIGKFFDRFKWGQVVLDPGEMEAVLVQAYESGEAVAVKLRNEGLCICTVSQYQPSEMEDFSFLGRGSVPDPVPLPPSFSLSWSRMGRRGRYHTQVSIREIDWVRHP